MSHSIAFRWGVAVVVLGILAWALVMAFRMGNQEVLYLLIGLLSVLLVSGVLSAVVCLLFHPSAPLQLARTPQSGDPAHEGGRLAPAWSMIFSRIGVRWFTPNGSLPVEILIQDGRESLLFTARMLEEEISREIIITDLSGLFCWRKRGLIPGSVQVDPPARKGKLAKDFYDGSDGNLESLEGKASGDVTDSRFYQSGDSIRRILWSVVAKQGGLARAGDRLMVRSEEKVTSRRVGLFFIPGGTNDESAAGFARACVEKDILGDDWVFATATEGIKIPLKRDRRKALRAIDATGGSKPTDLETSIVHLAGFVRQIAQGGGIGKLFVIVDESLLKGEGAAKVMSSAPHALVLAIRCSEAGDPAYPKLIKPVMVEPV